MRTYDAIEKISHEMIKDNVCEAIVLKGSIGRGDDDQYSDVDMYVIVNDKNMNKFLNDRIRYLKAYKKIIHCSYADFVGPQVIAIFEDGLHFDLYTVTKETLPRTDKVKVIYDPEGTLDNYIPQVHYVSGEACVEMFNDVLYNFIEADSAYKRKNYPWASRILGHSIASCAILLRYIYDNEYAYLGLKKINEVLPAAQYSLLEEASENLNKQGYDRATTNIIKILESVVAKIEKQVCKDFDHTFFEWIKENLHKTIFE